MNWLFVTTRFPWPLVDGHWLRVYHLIRALRESGDEVAIVSFEGDEDGKAAYASLGVRFAGGLEGTHQSRGPARVRLGPYAFDQRMAEAVRREAAGFDVVVLSGARMLQYAPEAARPGAVIADFIDDPVLEYGRRGATPRSARERLRRWKNRLGRRRYERRFLAFVETVTFVSDEDCGSFLLRHPAASATCIPNGVDVEFFQRPQNLPRDGAGRSTVVFTGHMSNPNNARAAIFLVREVAPHLWPRRPETQVRIVGADPSKEVLALAAKRVEVTGRVEDVRPYLWDASVVAIPMQSGTGIKNKLLEAWAAGAAVVATPLACQGVPAEDGRNLLLADAADAFAGRLLALLDDKALRARLGKAGYDTVLDRFTWDSAAARLRSFSHVKPGLPAGSLSFSSPE